MAAGAANDLTPAQQALLNRLAEAESVAATDFPVSSAQRRLWLVNQLAPDSSSYSMPVAVRLRGALDVDALRASVDALVCRHEALRTGFPAYDGVPRQRVHARMAVTVDVRRAPAASGNVPAGDPAGVPAAVLAAEVARPFDLANGPLLRVVLWEIAAEDHLLLIVLHHIVADGWSVGVLLRDLAVCYAALHAGLAPAFTALPVQQADYAVWEVGTVGDSSADDDLAYWQRQLSCRPPAVSWPGSGQRGQGISGRARTLRSRVDGEGYAGVRALARANATTEFVVLLTGVVAVLGRATGRRDIVIGSPASGRRRPELADVVGYFVNVLPLRFAWTPQTTAAGLLAHVRATFEAALSHQDVPLDRIVEHVGATRSDGHNPLYDVVFTVQDEPPVAGAFPGLHATVVPIEPAATKVDLTCVVTRGADHLDVQWDYRSDLLAEPFVDVLARSLADVLAALRESPDRSVDEITAGMCLPPAESASAPESLQAETAGAPDVEASDVEAAVVEVWATLLGVAPHTIGRDSDFFALGGQSFLAARAAARLSKRLGVDVAVREVFAHPTVAGLARALAEAAGASGRRIPRLPVDVTSGVLSHAQEQLFFLAQLAPDSTAYNIPLVARLSGHLDVAAFRRSVEWLLDRHEALRTRFELVAGEPRQRVVAPGDAALEWVERDLRGTPDAETEALALVDEHGFRAFDVTGGGPLVRALLLCVGQNEHVIGITVHHLVADGASVRVLARELGSAYHAFATGDRPDLPAPRLRFLDYAAWERARVDDDLVARMDFWRTALASAPHVLDLPTSRPRGSVGRRRGAAVDFSVDPGTMAALQPLMAHTGCTRFMALAAALGLVLGRYAGQRDVLIGTPAANRSSDETAELVGLLVNTVVVRADMRHDPTVAEFLERVRASCAGAFAHQDVPFEKVVEAVAPERSAAHTPLFQVMLAVNDETSDALDLPGVTCAPLYPGQPPAKFDLLLNVVDDGAGLRGVCEYDVDLFDPDLVTSLLRDVERALGAFARAGGMRLSGLDLLDDRERAAILAASSGPRGGYDAEVCLHRLVEDAARAHADAVAVVANTPVRTELTYRELDAAASAVAGALLAAGVRTGDRVGVHASRSVELVVAEYAALKAGAAFVPIDPRWPDARVAEVVHDAHCRVVLTDRARALPGDAAVMLVTEAMSDEATSACAVPARQLPAVDVAPADIAYVVYTSGSTGRPKGVEVPHRAIANNLLWMQQDWPLGGGDRLLHKTAATFDVGVKEIFWPLLAGATLVLARPGSERDPSELLAELEQAKATICHLVPSMLELCLDELAARGSGLGNHLRYVMCGAEELPAASRVRFEQACDAALLHMYGPTETAVAVTGWTCRRGDTATGRVPLGVPMPNSRLYVLDDRLRLCPPQVWGELYVGGTPVARGYLGRPAETAAAFVPDPYAGEPGARMYRTGDVVRRGPHGLLEFRGRADGQVKVRGFRVELGEVESALRALGGVRQAAAVSLGDRLAAFVVPADDAVAPDVDDVRRRLATTLPDYMVPAVVVAVPGLPVTEHGKVDRAALPALVASRPAGAAFVPPRDDVERAVAEVWSDVLGIADIGVDDDFFALGGHSLQAARIVTRLRERFQREVPVRDLFLDPTVAGLARLLRSRPARELPRITRRVSSVPATDSTTNPGRQP